MARMVLPGSTSRRTTGERTAKRQATKKPTVSTRPVETAAAPTRRRGQESLLLASTAQLRGGERVVEQDAQRRARRRRQAVRHIRQMEAVIERVRLPAVSNLQLRRPTLAGFKRWPASRIASAVILLVVIALITWVQSDLQWFVYREHVAINGLTYANAEQIYEASAVDSWNLFWLSPSAIRERLVELPAVADAQVALRLPNQVVIDIQEEPPVALWVTQAGNFWLLPDGTALPEPAQPKADLLQIIDHQSDAKAWNDQTGAQIDPGVLQSALALTTYLPDVEQIYFNAGYGLNFHLPNTGTWVYWGDGVDMEKKYTNLIGIERHLRTEGTQPKIIDVRFDKPILK
ncbi:MAG: hypothetical protein DYG89_07300 [Caldilinea sp. CFX5]|nr:hypothetical protein [Caldilinea sp. CFX5]